MRARGICMRIEDLTAKIWRHFAGAGKRGELDEPSQSHRPEVILAPSRALHWQRSSRSQWFSTRSFLSLELIDNRISKLRVRHDQAFLPSTTSSVATTAYLLRATSRRQQARLGYGVCGRRRDPGRDCSQNLTGKICVSELEPRNLNSATSKSRDLDQTTFLISSGLNTIKRSCFCHHWMNE